MRTGTKLAALASILVFAAAAAAGEGGFDCRNACPLAKQAGERRAYGSEGGAAARAARTAQVQKARATV